MNSPIKIEVTQGTPEWHEWRKLGIGSSEAAVIDGTSPYQTVRELFLVRTGQSVPEEDDSKEFIFAKGHKTEALIRKQFQEKMGVEINPICLRHPQFAYLQASLDGFDSTNGVLEGKLVGKDVLKKAEKDGEIPAHHYTQMQHQFLVSGVDIGNWFGHDGKDVGIVVPVRADLEFIKKLEDQEHQFWDDLKTGKIPALSSRDYLYPDHQGPLTELREAKILAKNSEAAYEALKAEIVKLYKHPKIAGGGVKLFKVARSGTIDWLAIPEIAAVLENLTPKYLEGFRRPGSESWSIKIETKSRKKK